MMPPTRNGVEVFLSDLDSNRYLVSLLPSRYLLADSIDKIPENERLVKLILDNVFSIPPSLILNNTDFWLKINKKL